jgi:hypothetical protein
MAANLLYLDTEAQMEFSVCQLLRSACIVLGQTGKLELCNKALAWNRGRDSLPRKARGSSLARVADFGLHA